MILDIFLGDALKKVKNSCEFRYMTMLRIILLILGAWPGKDLGEKFSKYETVPACVLIFIKTITFSLILWYIKIHCSSLSFFELGHNYITLFMTFISLIRLWTLPLSKKYRDVVKKFVTEMHLCYFKNESTFAMEIHVKVHKKSYFFTIYLTILLLVGLILFNSSSIYQNYKNGKFNVNSNNNISFEYAIYYVTPFDTATNLKAFIAVEIFNWFLIYTCSNIVCMFDLLLCVMVFHVCGHFEILINNLRSFPKPMIMSNNMKDSILNRAQLYSHQEMIEIEMKLKQCINYHRALIKFTNDISKAFGPMLFSYYVFHQVSGCILLLEISQMNPEAIIKYGPLTIILFQQLIQLSFIIESIGTVTSFDLHDEDDDNCWHSVMEDVECGTKQTSAITNKNGMTTGKLKDEVYGIPWEYMDTKNRKTVMIFLINVQEPLHVNALGLTKVGVTSMASIIKTSLSYFAFLHSVAQ